MHFVKSEPKMKCKKIAPHGSSTEREIINVLERKKLDRECSVPQEISWLKEAGFKTAECIYLMGKFAVILAEK